MSVKRVFFGIFQKLTLFCCAIFFGFTNAFSANLPAGYTELEYIESTGTQYINTGRQLSGSDTVELKFSHFTPNGNDNMPFGAYNGGRSFALNIMKSGSYYGLYFYYASPAGALLSTLTNYDDAHTVKIEDRKVYVDGALKVSFDSSSDFTTGNNAMLFSSGNYLSKVRIYYYRLNSSANTPIQSFVPARRDSDGEIGMYDVMDSNPSTAFHTNRGTGTFTAGPEVLPIKIATTAYNAARFNSVQTDLNSAVATIREIVTKTINQTAAIASLQADKQTRPEDACPAGKKCLLVEDNNGKPHWYEIIENICGVPSGYTCLDYIESTGTQYIKTSLTTNDGDISVQAVYEPASFSTSDGYAAIFGVETQFQAGYDSTGRANIGNATSTGVFFSLNTKATINAVLSTSSSRGTYFVNGADTGLKRQLDADKEVWLFAANNSDSPTHRARGKMYKFVAIRNNTIIMNLIPAKNSSGVIGVYDLADTNPATAFHAGTGTFTAGPEM